MPRQSPIPLLYLLAEADFRRYAPVSAEIRRVIRSLQPQLVIEDVEPFADMLGERVARPRLGAWLLGIFAALAVVLSAIGLMTTVSWWVSQRLRELGIRIAVGATRFDVTRLVVRQGVTLAGGGVALGCAAAAGVTRHLEGWIYGVTPLDVTTFIGATMAMFAVACVALCIPLRRAISIDPVVVLRAE